KEKESVQEDPGAELSTIEEQQKKREEAEKEAKRMKLLEDQIKQQERIRQEQERELAAQKKREEEEQRKAAAAKPVEKKEAKPSAPVFVPTKMANELDNDPKPIKKVSPVLPDLAKKAKISGTVSMRVLVGADGLPEEIYVSKRIGNKDFDQMINEAAIAAIKQWEFERGLSNGQPVKYWTVVAVLMK
ncbi:MAG: TonB family protein, partial [Bacteroidetes bacterium]|nr:TonB family protein [Bacteroidota bacterium]